MNENHEEESKDMKYQTITNVEGKFNGVLQTKVWKPGEARKDCRLHGQQLK